MGRNNKDFRDAEMQSKFTGKYGFGPFGEDKPKNTEQEALWNITMNDEGQEHK